MVPWITLRYGWEWSLCRHWLGLGLPGSSGGGSPTARRGKNLWLAVALVSLAAAAHEGWSANLFTLASDMFPKRALGSVVGIGGTAGSIGGMLVALVVGEILETTGSLLASLLDRRIGLSAGAGCDPSARTTA